MQTHERSCDPYKDYYSPNGYATGRRRNKTDWAGTTRGDAFSENLPYSLRLQAQSLFYRDCSKAQRRVLRQAGEVSVTAGQLKVKPQLGPCYSDYPSANFRAAAAIGLTAFLEIKARWDEKGPLQAQLRHYLADPAAQDGVAVDPETYKQMLLHIVRSLEIYLLLVTQARLPGNGDIEAYRLLAAGMQSLRHESLKDIVHAEVIYGDVRPAVKGKRYHPQAIAIAAKIRRVSKPFRAAIARAKRPAQLFAVAAHWARALAKALVPYLLAAERAAAAGPGSNVAGAAQARVAPLNAPKAPSFETPGAAQAAPGGPDAAAKLAAQLFGGAERSETPNEQDELLSALARRLGQAAEAASRQDRDWEDLRVDRLEHALRTEDFAPSPIEGSPRSGHDIDVALGGQSNFTGQLFDMAMEPSGSDVATDRLIAECSPLVSALRPAIYPNILDVAKTERFRGSGALDGSRLPLAGVCEAVFKRQRINRRLDQGGRALLLIACDGSSSLDAKQMKMLKLVTSAWLLSSVGTGVEVMAGLYHSGRARRGTTGTLVRWIYHKGKSPTVSQAQAVRCLAALPESGTGVQSDALSVSFMLDEAQRQARGAKIYLVLISDCAWNRSQRTKLEGKDEMRALLTAKRDELGQRLHCSLVALGVAGTTGIDDLPDQVVKVSKGDLDDVGAVARKVGLMVAESIRASRRALAAA